MLKTDIVDIVGQSDSTGERVLTLHAANPGSIPGIPYGPLSTIRSKPLSMAKCSL